MPQSPASLADTHYLSAARPLCYAIIVVFPAVFTGLLDECMQLFGCHQLRESFSDGQTVTTEGKRLQIRTISTVTTGNMLIYGKHLTLLEYQSTAITLTLPISLSTIFNKTNNQ